MFDAVVDIDLSIIPFCRYMYIYIYIHINYFKSLIQRHRCQNYKNTSRHFSNFKIVFLGKDKGKTQLDISIFLFFFSANICHNDYISFGAFNLDVSLEKQYESNEKIHVVVKDHKYFNSDARRKKKKRKGT